MARTSRNGAPAASFESLDNIDIDGMFADDGDDLFDGLDIDLDQMGDITNNIDSTEAADTSGDAKVEVKPAPTPAPVPAVAEEIPKRRKTKRKPKSPVLLDEEEDEAPKKKRRTAKTGTTKKKGSKKEKEKDKEKDKEKEEAKVEISTKSKSKVKGMGMPPPLARHPSTSPSTPTQGNVAAAGQFGGRQKRGHFSLPLSRTASDKHKTKSTKSSVKAAVGSEISVAPAIEKSKPKKSTTIAAPAPTPPSAPEPPAPKPPPVFVPPVPSTTYCGLKPSDTLFYPFMPALPAEPSIKNRKQYPVMDKINSSFISHINTTNSNTAKAPNGGGSAVVPETDSIFRLMQDTLKDVNPSGGQTNSANPQDDKKNAISNAIGSSRQTVATLEKPKLASDLFSVCSLLKRQYDFLQQNLANMEHWCKENFSETDFNATYGLLEAPKKQKEPAVESILSKFKKPLIKVKIKCNGFKEPKLSSPLFAFLPNIGGPASASDHSKEKKTSKKRRSASSEASLVSSASVPVAVEKEVTIIKSYSELRPAKRRQLVTDHIAHTAKELEAACISRTAARCQAIERRHNDLKKMVEEDEVLVIHTAAMWQYIDKAGYFAEFTEDAIRDTLRCVWAPEVKRDLAREILYSDKNTNGRIESYGESDSAAKGQSVFDGLQSLLVEVSSGDENDDERDDDDDDDEDDEDESALHDNFDEPIDVLSPTLPSGLRLADVSGLTLDERAYMHLCSAGLIENRSPPVATDSSSALGTNSSRGRKDAADGVTGEDGEDCDELEDIVERMSADLLELNKVNNARASFLESVARARLATMKNAKSKADEEAASIARCQQLLKSSKDSKLKASKPKIAGKDEYDLPW